MDPEGKDQSFVEEKQGDSAIPGILPVLCGFCPHTGPSDHTQITTSLSHWLAPDGSLVLNAEAGLRGASLYSQQVIQTCISCLSYPGELGIKFGVKR